MNDEGGYKKDPKGGDRGHCDGKDWADKKESKDSLNGWSGGKKKK